MAPNPHRSEKMEHVENTTDYGSRPAMVTRAESAPPTRGRDALDRPPLPLPKSAVPSSSKPPVKPSHSDMKTQNIHPTSTYKTALRRPKRMLPRDPMASYCSLALSRTESVLVSSSGDVMVCRCRRSSTPYLTNMNDSDIAMLDPWTNAMQCCGDAPDCIVEGPWSPVFSSLTVQNKYSAESTTSEGSTYEWEHIYPMGKSNPTTSTPPLSSTTETPAQDEQHADSSDAASRSVASYLVSPSTVAHQATTEDDPLDLNAYDGELLPLPSFDYDHIHEGQNDMLLGNDEISRHGPKSKTGNTRGSKPTQRRRGQPAFPAIAESPEEKKDDRGHYETTHENRQQPFFHGIPVFLTELSQIRISKVSSHPMGAHVLLISKEALLFSYGLNNHGQLGIGIKSSVKDQHRGFHTSPTLITPLLENGGKVLHCAAGVDHSLVVVATEGRRVHKLQQRAEVANSEHGAASLANTRQHSFGNVSPTNSAESQEALNHHQVYGFGSNDFMKIGLVNAKLADDGGEGDVEDILLPRRVALHCSVWPGKEGSKKHGELLPQEGVFGIAASAEHSAALVRRATGDIEVYMWGNATVGALGLPIAKESQVKVDGRLTQRPRSNANNIFPLPTVLECLSYRPDRESPLGFPRQVSLGPYCSFVVMSTGKCMSFGFSAEGMLGHGYGLRHTMEAKEVFFPPGETDGDNGVVSITAGAYHAIALTKQGHAYSWGINSDDRLGHGTGEFVDVVPEDGKYGKKDFVIIEWVPQQIDLTSTSLGKTSDSDSLHCIEACAGYDSSMLVARSGQVYSFGKRSGRLGKGEVASDVSVPEPLHGGLRLFNNSKRQHDQSSDGSARTRTMKPSLKRILSDGNVMVKK